MRRGDTELEKRTRAAIDKFNEVQRGYGESREWAILSPENLRRSLAQKERRREEAGPYGYMPSTRLGMAEQARSFATQVEFHYLLVFRENCTCPFQIIIRSNIFNKIIIL